jgi:type II secretory pathway pseudopilin PulG
MNLSPRSIALGASVATVVAAVAVGLVLLGSPAQERERRIDDRRVADLHGITAAAELYRTRHGRLPESLDDLAAEPGLRINTRDPTSSELYGYRVLDDGRYEVCATFAAESGPPTESASIIQRSCQGCHGQGSSAAAGIGDPVAAHLELRDLWAHGSGRQCFRMQAR